ncbi:MAG: hypothetical protein WCS62_05905 [Bacilli bacterium]|jgi:hypothetical protein
MKPVTIPAIRPAINPAAGNSPQPDPPGRQNKNKQINKTTKHLSIALLHNIFFTKAAERQDFFQLLWQPRHDLSPE